MTGDEGSTGDHKKVFATISEQAACKQRARTEGRYGVWFGLGMFGLVGRAVALPTLLGIALGIWLDARLPVGFSWTISLLVVGILFGCLNAWWWVTRESQGKNDNSNQDNRSVGKTGIGNDE